MLLFFAGFVVGTIVALIGAFIYAVRVICDGRPLRETQKNLQEGLVFLRQVQSDVEIGAYRPSGF